MSDEEVLDLRECGWGGDLPADAIADYFRDLDPLFTAAFTYLDLVNQGPNRLGIGFEVRVDAEAAEAWVAENRPALALQG